MAAHRAQRRRQLRRKRWQRAGIIAASTTVAGALTWLVGFSPVFILDASQIEVVGARETTAIPEITKIAASHAGISVARVDTAQVAEQVRAVSGVKDAEVTRVWPAGLRVDLTPRTPAAKVPEGDAIALFDADGVRLGSADELKDVPDDLPTVAADPTDRAAIRTALNIWDRLPAQMRSEVIRFDATSRDDVRARLHSGQAVRWGDDEEMPLKIAVVQTLHRKQPGASLIDVSSPALPVTR
jgi:cell division protein FtsQ